MRSNSLKGENMAWEEVHQGGEQDVSEEGKAVLQREGEIVEKAIVEGQS